AQASKLAALGQMSAAVAHELNQPLTAMRTYLATARHLSSKGDDAAAGENLGRIDALIGRMAALTRDLKAFARQDRAVSHAAELRAAVRHAAEILAERSQNAGAALSLSLGRGPTPVMAEAHRLEQIVLNLMQNAIDAVAGRNDARVEVTLKPRGQDVVLTIADNGPGLPAGDPAQVFAPFFTTKTAGEGLGLGLAISAAIAAELGGSIEAETRDEGGASFRLVLPRASA
ncbi:MAG: ATP-binding protein, partial [Pseudomonadota bacterium]